MSVSNSKSAAPSQTSPAGIDLGNLGQLSGPGWLDHSLSPYTAYGAIGSPGADAASGPAELATAYPLALAALQTALEFLDIGCSRTGRLFNQQDLLAPGQPPWGSLDQGALAAVSPRPSHRESAAALQRPARNPTALTLSAPIAGSGDLILAARRSSPAKSQRVQARAQTRPARQKPNYRHSWLRTATKSPAFALSSAAINGLMLLSPLVSFAETTTYGTGSSSGTTYTGGIINSGDTVILNDGATVSGADQITLYGALQFNQTEGPLYIENLITGNGILSLTNTGTLYLIGDKTYTGNTSIDLGTLVVLGSLAGSNVSVDTGATFQVDEEATIGSIAGPGTINLNQRSLTAGGSNSTTTFSGVMLDDPQYPSSFTKAGTGTLTLSGTNTYAGTTTISAGTLQIGAGGTSGAISNSPGIANNANLAFNRSDTTGYAGVISGSGNLTQLGSGSLTLSGTNNYTGNTSIVSGTLLVSGSLADSSNVSVATGATYQLGASDTVGSIAGNGTINIYSYNLTAGAANASTTFGGVLAGTGSFTKVGTGTLLLVGNNIYTGGTTLAGGTLSLGSNQALGTIGTISFSGGSLQFTENNTSDYSARFSQADNQAYAIDTNGQNISLATGLTSAGGSLTKQGTGTLTLTGNNTYTGSTTINAGTLQIGNGSGSASISNSSIGYLGFDPGSNGTASVSTGGTWTTTGDLYVGYAGNGSLTVSGGTVSNVNGVIGAMPGVDPTDDEPTSIAASNGTVIISGGHWTNTGSLTVGLGGNGTLTVSGGNVSNVNGAIGFNSAAIISGGIWTNSGDLYIAANPNSTLSITGGLVTVAGTLNKEPAGKINLEAGGSLSIGVGGADGQLITNGNFTNNGTLIFNNNLASRIVDGNLTTVGNQSYTSILSGSGSLIKEGSNALTLTGKNTYTGNTAINAGVLNINIGNANGSISSSSGFINNAKLEIITRGAYIQSYGGQISGSGTLLKGGGDSGTLILSGNNTYTGNTTIGAGTLQIGDGGTSGSLVSNVTNGRLAFNRSDSSTYGGVFSGTSLTKLGGGTLTLTGNNTHTGATTISAGTLQIGDGGTSGALSNSSSVANNSNLAFNRSDATSYGGAISGTGNLTQLGAGTLTLSGTNTYTGTTTISAGTLQIGAGGTGGAISNSSTITNNANLAFNRSNDYTYGGLISGGGTLAKLGAGTLTLSGNNTYTGSTTVNGGTLQVQGSIAPSSGLTVNSGATLTGDGTITGTTINAGGILAPNNAGRGALAITGGSGSLTLASGSISTFSIFSANSDRVTADGSINLDGVLNLAFSGDDSYLTATPYVLFSGQSRSGSFGSVVVSGLSDSYLYSLDYAANALNLWLAATVPAGQSIDISTTTSTTLSGGTLLINDPGAYNTSVVLANPTGSATNTIDGNGLTAVLSGTISGTGPLTFTNSQNSTTISNTVLSGNNTYTGATVVDGGARLSVDGSIASSANLTVNAGAIIGGNGTLPATTIQSGGYLAPGNSIGLLTAASLDFGPVAPGGILVAEFQGPQNDKTRVIPIGASTGSGTNFTGTANLSPYGGGNPWPNFDYQLITAANDFTTSSSLTLTPVGITSALLLQGTTPVQEVDGNAKTFDVMWRPNNGSGATASAMQSLGQGNRNQLAASGVFDSAFRRLASAAGDASGLTTGLNATGTAIGTTGFTTGQATAAGLSPEFLSTTAQLLGISSNSQLTAAISTITPEPYAAFQSVGLETLQRQRQQLLASAGQCASTGWVINGPTSKTAKAPKNPICLYGQAANANSSINGQDGLSSYNANLFSSFYGLEVKANPYWRFGAAYGYGTSNLNGLGLTNAWVTATVNSGSLYGVYTPTTTSPWTFKGLLGYGNYALNGSRQVAVIGTGTPITGSTTANGLTAALTAEVAIPLTKPSAPVPVLLKPLIGIAYGNYQQAGFSESGGGPLNLNVDGNSASSLVGTIGIELTSGPIPLNKAKSISLIPKLALAYQVDALASESGNSSLAASMPASGSGSFLTQGQNRGVNGFSIAAGADLALSQSTALYANVNVEAFSSGNQLGYGGGFRFKF